MDKIIHLITFILISISSFSEQTLIKKNESVSIWKYTENYEKYGKIDKISKKVYYISLYFDGNYHQYIEIIPNNSESFTGVKYYELSGKWSFQNNKLILEEYGKKQVIDYNFFNTNFENIDNLIFQKK